MKRVKEIHEAAKEYVLKSFSNSKEAAFKAGAKYADRVMIQKALDWLAEESNNGTIDIHNYKEFEERFIKAMKE